MDWQRTLVRIYLFVLQALPARRPVGRSARLSNNSEPTFTDETFTDEEVLTIYLFGIIKRRKTIKGIYDYTADHLSGWFPELPSYGGYNQRLNRLNAVFAPLVQKALSEIGGEELPVRSSRIVDSMPIMLASGKRSSNGKVATRLANEGYCSSKDTWPLRRETARDCRASTRRSAPFRSGGADAR